MIKKFVLSIFLMIISISGYAGTKPIVILLSFDGARPDYFNSRRSPNFVEVGQEGWRAFLTPIFPSESFPNHATLVTGCNAAQHGVVSNKFIDPKKGSFEYSMNSDWMECEPIWSKAKKAGLKTAMTYWPLHGLGKWRGNDLTYRNTPDTTDIKKIIHYDDQKKFDQILAWLDLPEQKRPQLILSWFVDIDTAGHQFGPHSKEVARSVQHYDQLLGDFMNELAKKQVAKHVNLIIVSDHGMARMTHSISLPFLEKRMNDVGLTDITISSSGTNSKLYSQGREKDKVYDTVVAIKNYNRAFDIFDSAHYPAEWGYQHVRSGEFLLVAKRGYYFSEKDSSDTLIHKVSQPIGKHGYPPSMREMRGTFFAKGPYFKRERRFQQIYMREIEPLISKILGLTH